jgi:hypothetical protein
MKWIISFVSATLLVSALLFSSSVYAGGMMGMTGGYQEGNMMGNNWKMPWDNDNSTNSNFPNMPWNGYGIFYHPGTFKIADLDLDETPEIILLQNETLIIMDNQGNILLTKEIEGIKDHHDVYYQHMGSSWGMNNSMNRLDVADLDGDQLPEIVIMDIEKLIVLNNMGEPKFIIPLPELAPTE